MYDTKYVGGVDAEDEELCVHVVLPPAYTQRLREIMCQRGYHGESWVRFLPPGQLHAAHADCPECGLSMIVTHAAQREMLKVIGMGGKYSTCCIFCAQNSIEEPEEGWGILIPPPFINYKRAED